MKRGTGINCIEFTGGNMLKVPPAADPNEANLNLEVKVFKLNPDGSKGELIRIEPAFREGWDHPQQFREKGFQKKKEDDEMARYNWAELWPQVQELQAAGNSIREIAEELDIELSVLRAKIYREKRIAAEKQTPEPEPAEAVNQEPERESQGPAENSISESTKNYKPQRITYTRTHYREKMEGLVAADDEPIPAEQETFNLDRFKVRVLEIFQEVAAQNEAPANVRLAFIDAIINTYV